MSVVLSGYLNNCLDESIPKRLVNLVEIMSVAGVSMSQKRRISDKWSSGPCIAFSWLRKSQKVSAEGTGSRQHVKMA